MRDALTGGQVTRCTPGAAPAWPTITSDLDRNAVPDATVPLWSETRWHCCWSAQAGVGIYIHTGRFRKDLDLWWAHVAAYLPDGMLAVDRFWFRNESLAGVESHNLSLAITENGWHSEFDGVGELTSTAALSVASRGCAAPSVALRWEVTATARAPVWDVHATTERKHDFASMLHIQQAATTTGTLWADGVEFSLEGVGFKDHSSGARTFGAWHGHRFMIAVMPGWVVHAFTVFRDDGTVNEPIGVVVANGQTIPVSEFVAHELSDTTGEPRHGTLVVSGPHGPVSLTAKIIHALPITITEDGDNYNGVDLSAKTDPMIMVEGIVALTTPDGERGIGFLERSARQSALLRVKASQ